MTIKLLIWAITALVIAKTAWQLFALWRAWDLLWQRERSVIDSVVVNPHNEFNRADNVPF